MNTSYLDERLNKLGITENTNKIRVSDLDGKYYDSHFFRPVKEGIEIKYFSPESYTCKYINSNGKLRDYSRIRLSDPKEFKYKQPYKSDIIPFITPLIIEKYKTDTQINTLIIVEGEFKAFSGSINGLDIIGISGIHNYKEKETKDIHSYIKNIIEKCKVKNIILLFDADCISENYIKESLEKEKDLYTRLYSFYSAVKKFRELTKELNIDIYFSHIKSEFESKAKGLDDLFICFKDNSDKIKKDLLKLEKSKEYFFTLNISDNSLKILYSYFLLNMNKKGMPEDFYEKFSAIIEEKEFIFKNITYQFDGKELQIIKHPAALQYIRVRTDYYFKGYRITSKNEKIQEIIPWKKRTILEDYGHIPKFINMIPRFVNFCNVPDNTETYQQEIEGCYNLYNKIKHIPLKNVKESDIENSLSFLKHLYGDKYEIALDIMTITYKFPTQNLPINCLVSKPNSTGKSLLLKWHRHIYGDNAIILGNEDFDTRFSTLWCSKLIIGIDESFIERKLVKEKIKRLSTDNKINFEGKGKDASSIDFIGKFILSSNNEDNFISMDDEDNRFFVRKVPVPKKIDAKLEEKLVKEIPAFLGYLNERKIIHPNTNRLWFEPKLYETPELKKVVQSSRSKIEKELINWFEEIFCYEEIVKGEIKCTPKLLYNEIKERVKGFYFGAVDVEKILKENWKLTPDNNQKFTFLKMVVSEKYQGHSEIIINSLYSTGKCYIITKNFIENL